MYVTDEHYLELLDIALNECRKKFDSGKPWEMEEALVEAKRFNIMGYRDQEIKLMEDELRFSNQEWWLSYQERRDDLEPVNI